MDALHCGAALHSRFSSTVSRFARPDLRHLSRLGMSSIKWQQNERKTSGMHIVFAAKQEEVTDTKDVESKTDEYTASMQEQTGTDLTYRHELGMNYAHVLPDIIVGSCLQNPADVDKLKEEGVSIICSLQQDPDLAYFGVDISEIQKRAAEVDGIEHIRLPIRDFDNFDCRMRLPHVIARLHHAFEGKKRKLYIHCTAGIGRAPSVALAYMHWIRGYDLREANSMLQAVRKSSPKIDMIRAATCDILTGFSKEPIRLQWKRGIAENVEIAGLDVGWYQTLKFTQDKQHGAWSLYHELPIGKYEYKYIIDGKWTYNPDAPLTEPSREGQINNYIQVTSRNLDVATLQLRERLLQDDAHLTTEEINLIIEKLKNLVKDNQEQT